MRLISIDDYADRLRATDSNFDRDLARQELSLKVGLAVRSLREEMGLSRVKFAKRVGHPVKAIAKIESGFEPVNLRLVRDIAMATGKIVDFKFV